MQSFGADFFDFNTAEEQKSFDLIPKDTLVPLVLTIKPGGQGEGGWLRPAKTSDAMMLDCEMTVAAGPFAKRKIFQFITVSGGKVDERGQSIGGQMGRTLLRGIIESARGINAKDFSDAAQQKRRIRDFGELNGIEFLAKIGVEKSKDPQYDDKNKVVAAITVGTKDWDKYFNAPAQTAFAAPSAQPAAPAPAWAAPAPTPQATFQQQTPAPSHEQQPSFVQHPAGPQAAAPQQPLQNDANGVVPPWAR